MRRWAWVVLVVAVLLCVNGSSLSGAKSSSPSVVLVTGFAPFGNYTVNPSGELAEALDGTTIDGCLVVGLVLPVNFTAAVDEVTAAIQFYAPVLVISTGLNARLVGHVAVEHMAVNLRQQPRLNGRWVPPVALVSGGPLVRRASIPVERCVWSLHVHQVPVRGSWWAGTYVCNAVFYGELLQGSGVPVGFVHVPLLDFQSAKGLPLSSLTAAVSCVIETALSSS